MSRTPGPHETASVPRVGVGIGVDFPDTPGLTRVCVLWEGCPRRGTAHQAQGRRPSAPREEGPTDAKAQVTRRLDPPDDLLPPLPEV